MKKTSGPLTIYGLPVLLLAVLLGAAMKIHNLTGEADDLVVEKAQLKVEKLGLVGELSVERTYSADLTVEIGRLDKQLRESVQLNVALEEEVHGLNSQLTTLNKELESSLAREGKLSSELAGMSAMKVKLENQIFSLETDVGEQESRISQLTTRISELQYSLAEARERSAILMSNNDDLMEEMGVMNTRLTTSEHQNAIHKQTINALTEEGSTLVKHTEKLNSQLADMTGRFDRLSLEAEEKAEVIEAVSSERDTFKSEAVKLGELLSIREGEKQGLADELQVLEDNFQTVKINNTNLTAAYEELVAEAKYNEEINATLEEDLMEQVEQVDTLRTSVTVLEERLKNSEKKVNLVTAESDERAGQLEKLTAMLDESEQMQAGLNTTVGQLETELAESRAQYELASAQLQARGMEVEEIQSRMAEAIAELAAQQSVIDSYHSKLEKMEAISIDVARLMADESGENAQLNDIIGNLEQELLVIKAQTGSNPKISTSTEEEVSP